jgi:hypothetical protein
MSAAEQKYYVNPNLFFLFEKGSLCLWNYEAHEHFEIEKDLLGLLVDVHGGKEIDIKTPLFADLIENDIVRAEPYDIHPWGWDRLSHIFHIGTKNIPELQEQRSKKEMIQDFIGFSEGYAQRKNEREKHNVVSKKSPRCITLSDVQLNSIETPLETLSALPQIMWTC